MTLLFEFLFQVHDGVDFNEEKDHQLAVLNSLIKHHNNESTKNELK